MQTIDVSPLTGGWRCGPELMEQNRRKDEMTDRNRQRIAVLLALAAVAGTCAAQTPQSAPSSGVPASQSVASSSATHPAAVEEKPLNSPRPAQDAESRPLKSASNRSAGEWIQTALAFVLVVAMIFAARWLLKKTGRVAATVGGGAMEVLARTAVSGKQQLLLVRVGRRIVLLGEGSQGLTSLGEFRDEEAEELQRWLSGGKGGWVEEMLRRTASRDGGAKVLSRQEGGDQ